MVSVADLRTYVVNLRRRPDRRERVERLLPAELAPTFTSDWDGPFDGHDLSLDSLVADGYRLFPWAIDSDNPWWRRPLKYGEIGCTLAHLACWTDAADRDEPYVLVLEDDIVVGDNFLRQLLTWLSCVEGLGPYDLLYLGRYPLEPDTPVAPGLVVPGYSHCTFAYLLARGALGSLLDARLDQAIVPIDEFLPAMYHDHQRLDLRSRFPARLKPSPSIRRWSPNSRRTSPAATRRTRRSSNDCPSRAMTRVAGGREPRMDDRRRPPPRSDQASHPRQCGPSSDPEP